MDALPLPTRLMLTNLPPSLTTPLLRAHLQRCPPSAPPLTDLKILLKPDGTSRRIAFVGFKENKEAERVRKWVDGSWVQGVGGGSSVRADWAKETKDAPPSKKRVKVAATVDSTPQVDTAGMTSKEKDEASRFAEFLSVMAPRKNRAVEEEIPVAAAPVVKSSVVEAVVESQGGKDGVVEDEEISDMEYMERRRKRMREGEDEEGGEQAWVQDEADGGGAPVIKEGTVGESTTESTEPVETGPRALIKESSRLFIRNLGYSIKDEDLRELLEPFGELENVHIPLDPATKAPKGMAYATFLQSSAALAAFEELDQRSFQGRLLHIIPAIARNQGEPWEGKDRDGGVKGARDLLRKKEAGSGLSWGTLFMNSDAVLDSVADRLKISKSELLDPSSDNAAVRVALAESHVIAETKKYFETEGVNLVVLTTPGPRSNTTVLVKNLPYNTSSATLTALFSPFGTISRLLLPPSGTIAIVEMSDSVSASNAWRGLVYKKVGGSVLYLEKAPAGLFSGPPPPRPTALPIASTSSLPTPVAPTPTPTTIDESEAGSTLFIKNLPFSCTSALLSTTFSSFPSFLFARVQTKPNPGFPGQTQSMGFGFVGFRTISAATEAKAARENYVMEGHKLEIKFAMRGKEKEGGKKEGERTVKEGTTTKIIVKNVPFEITRKEIRELFSAYGQLKSVRLPRKIDHKTRGFAFLDFASRRDAESAFDALEHTHLLGRHLVLQWAEEGAEAVEELRKRVGGFSKSSVGAQKSKFVMGGDEVEE